MADSVGVLVYDGVHMYMMNGVSRYTWKTVSEKCGSNYFGSGLKEDEIPT